VRQPPGFEVLLDDLSRRERHDPRDDVVRFAVQLRARDRCEYCLLPTVGRFHVDHIIPSAVWDEYAAGRIRPVPPVQGRAGPDHLSNFAWSCPFCNTAKGRRLTGWARGRTYRLFDPRRDSWPEHLIFVRSYLFIAGVSGIGRATTQALGFNGARLGGPLGTRHEAILAGHYPPSWAQGWLVGAGP
jgi:hypothetical protein